MTGTTNKNDTVHFKQWVTVFFQWVTKTDALLLDMMKKSQSEQD